MAFDLLNLIAENRSQNYELYSEHVNPQFTKVLKTIGFDRIYERGEGPWLWDVAERKYLDMLGGYAVHNAGRNHPVIRKAITDWISMDSANLVQFDAPLLSGLLASELTARTGLDKVFFTNSGTEGIEAALKFARCATGRPEIISCQGGYHGLSFGSLSVTADENFREGFGPFPSEFRSIPFNDLEALSGALSTGDVAAFVIEPIQGKGVNIPDDGYLREAARLCRAHGSLFIADEVQTGLGRTGSFLAVDHDGGVDPDIVVLSKALSGGYVPVGAVLTRDSIWNKVFSSMERSVVHSSTFRENGLAMAAGLSYLSVMDDEKLIERANAMGGLIRDGLQSMLGKYEFLKSIRQRGLMVGIELGPPKSLKLRAAWKLVEKMDRNLFPQAVVIPLLDDHGILTQVAGHNKPVIKLIPPLVIDESDVHWFLEGFEAVMKQLHRFPGPAWTVLSKLGKNAVTRRDRS